MNKNLLAAAILCLLALAVLSWTPGVYMLRTGVLSGQTEHFLAYFLSATILSAAQRRATASVWIGLMLYAAVLELGQLYVPGRHAAAADFCASAFGVVASAAIAFAFLRTIERPIRVRIRAGLSQGSRRDLTQRAMRSGSALARCFAFGALALVLRDSSRLAACSNIGPMAGHVADGLNLEIVYLPGSL